MGRGVKEVFIRGVTVLCNDHACSLVNFTSTDKQKRKEKKNDAIKMQRILVFPHDLIVNKDCLHL